MAEPAEILLNVYLTDTFPGEIKKKRKKKKKGRKRMYRGRREEVQECQQLIRFWPFFIRSSFEAKSRKKYRFVVDTI